MTREEAIEVIKDIYNYTKWDTYTANEARTMAIIALEQEPCPNAINRSDMLDAVGHGTTYTSDDLQKIIKALPPVTLRSLNLEADREASKAYCAECDHIEMCSWYPHDGCEWLKTDRYNAGYNAAKREIALSGEYERAYERGKADAQPKTGHWEKTTDDYCYWYRCSCCGTKALKNEWGSDYFGLYCPECGAKMIEPQESEDKG